MVLPLPLAAAPLPPRAAPVPPARDWTKTATRLPSGAFLWGNPDAKVHVVEYLSLTCPHCAYFSDEGAAPFAAKYVRPGLVSYEVRHALRDAFDYAGSLLARCDGPDAFFARLPRIYAQQNDWFAKAETFSRFEQIDNLPPDQLLPKVARGADFAALFGMTPAHMDICLGNKAERDVLTAQAGDAWRLPGMKGTPGFSINDAFRSDIAHWADLDAALAQALHLSPSPRKITRR